MNVLPWLLDWPPSLGTVAVFLLVTVVSVATLAAFGGVVEDTADNVTIETADLSVRLNDDGGVPDVEAGTVRTCLASGTPGDSIGVFGDVTVEVPPDRRSGSRELILVVSLVQADDTTTSAVERTGRTTVDVFWVLDDDETLSVGDTAELRVRVRDGDSTVAAATRRVAVENGTRSYDC